jgi:hypothetical protein
MGGLNAPINDKYLAIEFLVFALLTLTAGRASGNDEPDERNTWNAGFE